MNSETVNIEINSVTYPLKFGYGALKQLGKSWGLNDLQDVFLSLGKLGDLGKGKLGFESMDMLGDITLAGILSQDPTVDLDRDQVVQVFLHSPEKMAAIMQEFAASLPKQEPTKKKIPAPKRPTRNKA